MTTYKTSEIAKIVGVHPNTVRLYETIGFISAPKRLNNGYRVYTERQLFELKLARLALKAEILHKGLRQQAIEIIRSTAAGEDHLAHVYSVNYRKQLIVVEEEAETAVQVVSQMICNQASVASALEDPIHPTGMKRNEAAAYLGVSIDTLRNWELNGLLEVPRTDNGYRYYTPEVLQIAIIIRSLRHAGYSLMSILRMLKTFEKNSSIEIRDVLDTPNASEDIISVYDRLLSCLHEAKEDTNQIIEMLETSLK